MSLKYRLDIIDTCVQEGYGLPGQRTEKGSALKEAAFRLDMPYSTLKRWYYDNKELRSAPIDFPILPPEDLDIEEILDFLESRNEVRLENAQAKQWQTIGINSNEPCVIVIVGDTHLDDPGTDLKLLRDHIKLMNQENVYAFSCGDTHNNWPGSMKRLYAEQDVSLSSARKLVNWFMNESGVNWLGWVGGNHDLWEQEFDVHKLMNKSKILMEEWEMKVKLKFPSGLEVPMWISHDFKGKSVYNKVAGAVKASRERGGAVVLACGHTHDFSTYSEELPDTGTIVHSLRVRGYKFNDQHALVNGFPETKNGSSIALVINPLDKNTNSAITVFTDLEKAIKFKNVL